LGTKEGDIVKLSTSTAVTSSEYNAEWHHSVDNKIEELDRKIAALTDVVSVLRSNITSATSSGSVVSVAQESTNAGEAQKAKQIGDAPRSQISAKTSWADVVSEMASRYNVAQKLYWETCHPNGTEHAIKGETYACGFHRCIKTTECTELGYNGGCGQGGCCACGAYNDDCNNVGGPALPTSFLHGTKETQTLGNFAVCNSKFADFCNGKQHYPWHTFLDSIQIINLKRRPERRRYMTDMLVGIGVPVEKIKFFDAIDVLEWGTIPFQQRLTKIFNRPAHEMYDGDIVGHDCCTRRLKNHSYACDVKECGLASSGLSHLVSIVG
jgi:hypothetical protein